VAGELGASALAFGASAHATCARGK
jgi:hypothetical protein